MHDEFWKSFICHSCDVSVSSYIHTVFSCHTPYRLFKCCLAFVFLSAHLVSVCVPIPISETSSVLI
jgi:hypothetical protein